MLPVGEDTEEESSARHDSDGSVICKTVLQIPIATEHVDKCWKGGCNEQLECKKGEMAAK